MEDILQSTKEEIKQLRNDLFALNENRDATQLHAKSLLNLKHYLALRSEDRTQLQEKLFCLGLSSLGRSYAHILASIDTIYERLHCQETPPEHKENGDYITSIQESLDIASHNTRALFGKTSYSIFNKQHTSIMVTLPSNATDNNGLLIKQLASAGTNVFRINTAHDNLTVWHQMAAVIKGINEGRDADEQVKIFVDLAGPKIRTGKIQKKLLPVAMGSNKTKKEVLICTEEQTTRAESTDPTTLQVRSAQIAVKKSFFGKLHIGDTVKVTDSENKKTHITIIEKEHECFKGLIEKKVLLNEASKLRSNDNKSDVRNIEMQAEPIRLFIDDELIITEEDAQGRQALTDVNGNILEPALIPCSTHGILTLVKTDERVFIDDGKIALKVLENRGNSLLCKVTSAKEKGVLLKEEKGINFPDTHVQTQAITKTDANNALSVLDFADSISISFCQDAEDINKLHKILCDNNRKDIGIIAKIETKRGVENMPLILEELLKSQKSAVMIARGDLAIEVGFENLAYIQEALLDICDAAHIPVIWATQVLENKMKNNLPSRAEITDAAMSGRAECVMLNKGAFTLDTIDALLHILEKMHTMSKKNRQLLKKETLWF
jgi:pyruvate kinase